MSKLGKWKGLFKYLLGFGLLTYVVWANWTGPTPEPGQPPLPGLKDLLQRQPNFLALLIAVALMVPFASAQFYRWYLLVRAQDLPFTIREAFRLGLVGFFYNAFLPGSVGGDLVKAFYIAKGQPSRKAAAVATVVADRLFGLFGLILFVAAGGGLFWALGNPQIEANKYLQFIIRVCAWLVAGSLVGWLVLGFLPERRAERFAGRLRSLPLGNTFAELWYTIWTYRKRPKTVAACVGLSAVTHSCYILIFHFAFRVFPPTDLSELGSLAENVSIVPIGLIMEAFFPAPGGVGGGEAIFGWLYTLLDKPLTLGVAGRLTVRMIQWGFGLIGYITYLSMRKELPVEEAEQAEESEDYGDPELAMKGEAERDSQQQ